MSDQETPFAPAPGYGAPPSAPRRRMRWWVVALIALGSFLGSLFVALVLLRILVFQPFTVPSKSMAPAVHTGARIVVDKLSYDFRPVHRGDVVVFHASPAAIRDCAGPTAASLDLVKRVIGLPGDVLSLTKGSRSYVLVNGTRLNEPWLAPSENGTTYPAPTGDSYSLDRPYRVPVGEYFVLGDLRTDSCDSRYWGPVPKSSLIGPVVVTLQP